MSTLLEVGALLTWASNALACSLVLGTKGRNGPLGLLVAALSAIAAGKPQGSGATRSRHEHCQLRLGKVPAHARALLVVDHGNVGQHQRRSLSHRPTGGRAAEGAHRHAAQQARSYKVAAHHQGQGDVRAQPVLQS
jgi:hypothetical protein